ncbi:unnamed protein product, partial [Symbiodinium sp. KB8]
AWAAAQPAAGALSASRDAGRGSASSFEDDRKDLIGRTAESALAACAGFVTDPLSADSVACSALSFLEAREAASSSPALERLRAPQGWDGSAGCAEAGAAARPSSVLVSPVGPVTALSDPRTLAGPPAPMARLEVAAAATHGAGQGAALDAPGAAAQHDASGSAPGLEAAEALRVTERLLLGGRFGGSVEVVVEPGAALALGRSLPVHASPVAAAAVAFVGAGRLPGSSRWAALTASADGEVHVCTWQSGGHHASIAADCGGGTAGAAGRRLPDCSQGGQLAPGLAAAAGQLPAWLQPRAPSRGQWGLRGGAAAWGSAGTAGTVLLAQRHDGAAAPLLACPVALPDSNCVAFALAFDDVDLELAEAGPAAGGGASAPPVGPALPSAGGSRPRGVLLFDSSTGGVFAAARAGDMPATLSSPPVGPSAGAQRERGAGGASSDAGSGASAWTAGEAAAWEAASAPLHCRPQLLQAGPVLASASSALATMQGGAATFAGSDADPAALLSRRASTAGGAAAQGALAAVSAGSDCVVGFVGSAALAKLAISAKAAQRGAATASPEVAELLGALAAGADAAMADLPAIATSAAAASAGGLEGSVATALIAAAREPQADGAAEADFAAKRNAFGSLLAASALGD